MTWCLTTYCVAHVCVCLQRYYEQCSEAEFPANVPCVVALAALDAALAFQSLGSFLLQLVGLS